MSGSDEFARLAAERDQRYALMIDAAGDLFQMYQAYIKAGFNAEQSLQLVLAILTSSINGGGEQS